MEQRRKHANEIGPSVDSAGAVAHSEQTGPWGEPIADGCILVLWAYGVMMYSVLMVGQVAVFAHLPRTSGHLAPQSRIA